MQLETLAATQPTLMMAEGVKRLRRKTCDDPSGWALLTTSADASGLDVVKVLPVGGRKSV